VDKVEFTLFDHESITLDMQNTRAEWHKLTVSFKDFSARFNAIMGNDLKKQFNNDSISNRVEFMIKAYIWILLKYAPSLWTYIDIPISGLKELILMLHNEGKVEVNELKSKLQKVDAYISNIEEYLKEKGL
jgi:hypothetical protein